MQRMLVLCRGVLPRVEGYMMEDGIGMARSTHAFVYFHLGDLEMDGRVMLKALL
jgi:hypothetical protein